MGLLKGQCQVSIDAPMHRCYEVAADVESAPEWQSALKAVAVLERDDAGRPVLVETEYDAKVTCVRVVVRFAYDTPTRISWVQEDGDTKSVRGAWSFSDLGGGHTRATLALQVDPGRVLGLFLRGPAVGRLCDSLLAEAAAGLKREAVVKSLA
jgi:uncharacterized membrane protein